MSDVVCDRCGAFGEIPHSWTEGDCVLPHRNHSRKLVTGTHVCEPCVERWETWLTDVTNLYATLPAVIPAGSVPDTTAEHSHTKKAAGSPAPFRLDAWALHHNAVNTQIDEDGSGVMRSTYLTGLPDIPDLLTNWAEAIWTANEWGDGWPTTVTGAAAAIRANLTTLAADPDCDTFDAELKWIRRALRQAHGISDPKPLFACISVGCSGNVWQQTAGQPKCDRCARRYGTLDYVRAKQMQNLQDDQEEMA